MEEHISRRAEILRMAKGILLKSPDPDEELVREILVHEELLLNRDIILNKDFHSILRSRANAKPEMVELMNRKEQVECVEADRKQICPISQKEVVIPYVGECGHVLEKKEAIRYLRNNGRQTCPYVGCNKRLVRKR